MSDLQQDIGGLKARMEEHDKRFDRLESQIDTGFTRIHARLDGLAAAENRRKGALRVLVFVGGLFTAAVEGARALFGK
jgi:hypothetical protein